jgi:GNAT superfamily N-acetyltransferase
MESSFGWNPTPEQILKRRIADERYKYPFGFCLMKGKTLAGFVGVMDIPVKTIDGKIEKAGGIHNVATYPNFSRQGIARELFDFVHNHFKALGYRFSFLFTSKSLVAYSFYEKIGYKDFTQINKLLRAYKIFNARKQKIDKKLPTNLEINHKLIETIFSGSVQNQTGFTARNLNWSKAIMQVKKIPPQNVYVEKDGYAFVDSYSDVAYIMEFIANKPSAYRKILDKIRKRKMRILISTFVRDKKLIEIYKKQGFIFRQGTYFSFMHKALTSATFEQVFGNKFYLSALDTF